MSPGFDYGNARLRAMKSRLLTRRDLVSLSQAGSLQGLITSLIKTAYRKSIEAALVRASGLECIAQGLRDDLVNTLGKIRTFYSERPGEMVRLILRAYDIHNLKAILRSLSQNVPPGDILDILLPIGDLQMDILSDLVRAPGPRGAIDLLASIGSPFARPLLKLRAEAPGAETLAMEYALDHWYFKTTLESIESGQEDEDLLLWALRMDADLANLQTVLRLAQATTAGRPSREAIRGGGTDGLLVGPGLVKFDRLSRALSQNSMEAVVETLAGTPYEPALRAGMRLYIESNRLSDFEKQLRLFRLRQMSRWMAKDPLGIGVVLGYIALKTHEVINLRWITQGVNLGLKPEAIQAELEFAT